jgi:hypothetical protein
MSPETEGPQDPFVDPEGGVLHHIFSKGGMVFEGLAERPNVSSVMNALGTMSESDLKCVVMERLYVWHAERNHGLRPHGWLKVHDSDS